MAAAIFGPLAEASINVDMIVQSVSGDGQSTDMTFTVAENDLERAVETLKKLQEQLGCDDIMFDSNVVKVSVIGVGMRSHAGVAQTMFSTLAEGHQHSGDIHLEIKVSVLIDEEYMELALRSLHAAYGLDAE